MCVHTQHVCSMYSFVNGLLGCPHLFTSVNAAAMNIHIQAFECLFSGHLGIELGVQLVGHVIIHVAHFRNHQTAFCTSVCHFTFLAEIYGNANFFTSSPTVAIFLVLFSVVFKIELSC